MSQATIPVTRMMDRYLDLRRIRGQRDEAGAVTKGLLVQHLEKAQQTATRAGIAELADDFHASVQRASEFFLPENVDDERFYGSDRPPLRHEPGLGSTSQVQALFQSRKHELWEVTDHPSLNFWYLDRELVATQARGLKFENGRGSKTGPRIDLLLANADGTPVIGELKVAGDSNPYLALVQALASAAYLTPKLQRLRLRHHDHDGSPRLAEELGSCDVYLVIAKEIEGSEPRRRILEVTNEIATSLTQLLSPSIRRIAAVRLTAAPDQANRYRAELVF